MFIRSKIKPEEIKYELIFSNVYKIYFRNNIVEHETYFSYNEYYLITEINGLDIEQEIKDNYNSFFEIAKANEEERKKEMNINNLKHSLENTDYKTIKSLESYVLGLPLSYDYSELISKRQAIRDEINNIEMNIQSEENELQQLKARKINEICAMCQTTITNGIDYNNEHYRLNTTDQINLTSLYALAQKGQSVPYHADGKVCRIFSSEEMIGLVEKSMQWIIYHTTYFNLLKHQIIDMETKEEVENAVYGMELNEEYQQVLNSIIE